MISYYKKLKGIIIIIQHFNVSLMSQNFTTLKLKTRNENLVLRIMNFI